MHKLATFPGKPTSVAVDDTNIYVNDRVRRLVLAVPKAGGAIRELAHMGGTPSHVALHGNSVYILTGARIFRVPKQSAKRVELRVDGQSPHHLAKTGGYGLGLSGDALFISNHAGYTYGFGTISQLSLRGGLPVQLAALQPAPMAVGADATHVYFVNKGRGSKGGALLRVRRPVGSASP